MMKGVLIMLLDDYDMKILKENFDEDFLNKLDYDNVNKIYNYLINLGVYYAKDLFLSDAYLFEYSYDEFVLKFDKLILELGDDFIDMLGEDCSLINSMYDN